MYLHTDSELKYQYTGYVKCYEFQDVSITLQTQTILLNYKFDEISNPKQQQPAAESVITNKK